MKRSSVLLFRGGLIAILAAAPVQAATTGKPKPEPKVYLAPSGTVYHRRECIALKHLKSAEAVAPREARRRGRRECYYCFPDKPATGKSKPRSSSRDDG